LITHSFTFHRDVLTFVYSKR